MDRSINGGGITPVRGLRDPPKIGGGSPRARRAHQALQLLRVHRGRPQPRLLLLRQALPLQNRNQNLILSLFVCVYTCVLDARGTCDARANHMAH